MNHPTTIQTVVLPEHTRILVISDIHGHCSDFKHLLQDANYTLDDILIINGDLTERGSENLSALRYAMELSKSPNVFITSGNVDTHRALLLTEDTSENILSLIKAMLEWHGCSIYTEMLDELGLPYETAADIEAARPQLLTHFQAEWNFLLSLPTVLDTQSFTVVHGGLPTPDLSEIEKLDGFALMKNDAFLSKGIVFPKYLIVGHWPVVNYGRTIAQFNPIVNEDPKIISIDGGCGVKPEGQLNLIIFPHIQSTDFSLSSYDSLPYVTALDAQEASKESVNLTWPNLHVEILEKGETHTAVRHRATGKVLTVSNDCLFENENEIFVNEYTDYHPAILPGDRVKLITKAAQGYFVKKNGVLGWYSGRIQEENK